MSYRTIVDEIVNRISQVENVGIVHPYQRYTYEADGFKTLFKDARTSTVRAWLVSRVAIRDEQSADSANTVVHTFEILGFMSLSDVRESELEFQELVDAVAAQFRPQGRLGGVCEQIRPIQVEIIARDKISGHFCHTCRMTIEVQEYFTSA